MSTFSAIAYAKLNLALHVTGQREDGYHLLDSLVTFANYGDHLTVRHAAHDLFTLSGPYGQNLPVDGNNLVLKARDALRAHYSQANLPVALHLEKNLPVASGIGGGSSDAAAAIVLLLQLWNIAPEQAVLHEIALSLGADVPMCLHAQFQRSALIARGIGEELEVFSSLPSLPLVLINDGTAISTPAIFKAMHKRDNPPLSALTELKNIEQTCAYLNNSRNDLFVPATSIAPQLPQMLQLLHEHGALFAQMSGSGATCFGIFATQQAADDVALRLHALHPQWFICATTTISPQT